MANEIVLSRRALAAVAGLGVAMAAGGAAGGADAARPAAFTESDRAAVIDLFSAFCWSFDCTDEEAFLDLFTGDALVVGMGVAHRGREAIARWFRYLVALREKDGDDWLHEAGQFRFVPDGAGCIAYAYATHFGANPQTGARFVRSLGYFVADCVRADGRWRFRRFSISGWDKALLPWKKPLPWDGL